MTKHSIFSVSCSSRLKTQRARKLLSPLPPSKMQVKVLWDSAQSLGFMLHLLNSHKKYQLKYCDFGRNVGNLQGDSSSMGFLHLQCSAAPARCLSGQEGLPGRCHAPLRLHQHVGRSPFPPVCAMLTGFCLSWHPLTASGWGGIADTVLEHSVAQIWDILSAFKRLDWEGGRGGWDLVVVSSKAQSHLIIIFKKLRWLWVHPLLSPADDSGVYQEWLSSALLLAAAVAVCTLQCWWDGEAGPEGAPGLRRDRVSRKCAICVPRICWSNLNI